MDTINNEYKVFSTLNQINVSDKTERKNGFTYLSWAWAWGEVKKLYPTANYKVYENDAGWNYFTDGRTAWVKVGVTIEDLEHVEMLPVMDFKNNSIPLDNITSCNVNKAIQRALTKAIARHGLGLYIYAGEDLPEDDAGTQNKGNTAPKKATKQQTAKQTAQPMYNLVCGDCGSQIKDYQGQPAAKIAQATAKKYGKPICMTCSAKRRALAEQAVNVPAEAPIEPPMKPVDDGELPFEIAP